MRSLRDETKSLVFSLFVGFASLYVSQLALQLPQEESLRWDAEWVLSAAAFLAISRGLLSWLKRRWSRSGCLTQKIVVVGATDLCSSIVGRLAHSSSKFQFAGVYDDLFARMPKSPTISQGDIADLIERCRRDRIDIIVIAVPLKQIERIAGLVGLLSVTVSDIRLATDILTFHSTGDRDLQLAIGPSILVKRRPITGWEAVQKRIFDVILSTLALVLLLPILSCIAVAIKIDSPGPFLFRQTRLGFNNSLFSVYKFRTMHHHLADLHADQQTSRGDLRVTRTGRWLRRLSLDELPQLLNVLVGEMSLVGPRPHALNTKAGEHRFTEAVANYAMRHRVKPGITGWAQVNGWRGETKTIDQLENRVACDLHYIDNWSFFFDVKILILTVLREISSSRAY